MTGSPTPASPNPASPNPASPYPARHIPARSNAAPPNSASDWQIGPFTRAEGVNPIIKPTGDLFTFPTPQASDAATPEPWENGSTFNPAAAVIGGRVALLYRAENDPGLGVGQHRSSVGLAFSSDGLHFDRESAPVLYLDLHNRKYEDPGGCEDPRVVRSPNGGFVMTYTSYDRKTARLCIATSNDLRHWTKHGPAFAGTPFQDVWSKSGSIVCRMVGGEPTAAKIEGKYWMYWGEEPIRWATSTDLIHWKVGTEEKSGTKAAILFDRRPGRFDSALVEPGPPAIITPAGIVFIYNGKNADKDGDPSVGPGAYSAGQALLDPHRPTKLLARTDRPFLIPTEPFERTGQYRQGTVFAEGLVQFKGRWLLYFGTADSFVGVATSPIRSKS